MLATVQHANQGIPRLEACVITPVHDAGYSTHSLHYSLNLTDRADYAYIAHGQSTLGELVLFPDWNSYPWAHYAKHLVFPQKYQNHILF